MCIPKTLSCCMLEADTFTSEEIKGTFSSLPDSTGSSLHSFKKDNISVIAISTSSELRYLDLNLGSSVVAAINEVCLFKKENLICNDLRSEFFIFVTISFSFSH